MAELNKFIRKANEAKKDGRHSYYYNSYDKDKTLLALLSFNKNEIKKIVSDKYWINYPTWSSSTNKKLGPALRVIVDTCSKSYPKLFDFISKNGKGLWRVYCMDYSYGKQQVALCSKYLNSKDQRVRLRVARNIPCSRLKKLINDKNASVRNMAMKRLGMSNCYSEIIKSDHKGYHHDWIKRDAIRHAELSEFEYKEELMSALSEIDDSEYIAWGAIQKAEFILSKMSKEDVVYYMDHISSNNTLASSIMNRLGSEWG